VGAGPEDDEAVGPYQILFKRSAETEFLALPSVVQVRFAALMPALAKHPMRPRPGRGTKPLHGGTWHLRVGAYRGIYEVEERVVRFTRVGHRSTVYR
jgi:mRNA-degrading endonuclease RelE of RelBE toxin-antitoxin system